MFPNLGIAFVALIISLAVLVKGSELFLGAASKIAKHFGISEFIIGLTLVSVGTSLPELATAITSSIAGTPDIIIGNIVGSNIADIGLILGITAVFLVIIIKKFEYEGLFIMTLSVLVFSLFSADFIISRFEAVILLVSFLFYFGGVLRIKEKLIHPREFFSYFWELRGLLSLQRLKELKKLSEQIKEGKRVSKKLIKEAFLYEVAREFTVLILAIVLLALGAKFTIDSAVDVAAFLNVSQAIIAALLISIGTTLPELSVNILGIRKKYTKLVLGNILGSVIFNTLAIIGIAGVIRPIQVSAVALKFLIPTMLIFAFLLFVFLRRSGKLGKPEGITFLLLYAFFVVLLLLSSFPIW